MVSASMQFIGRLKSMKIVVIKWDYDKRITTEQELVNVENQIVGIYVQGFDRILEIFYISRSLGGNY